MPRQAITMMSWLITAWHVAYDIKIYGYPSLSMCVCVCEWWWAWPKRPLAHNPFDAPNEKVK